MRERRLLFGSVADAYERFRPGYPDALVEDVLRFAGLRSGEAALEVGAGTGKATRAFLARGVDVVCLEPDAEMGAVLRRTCPGARVETVGFEDYRVPDGGIGLLYSAQAWHWVRPEARVARLREVLRPAGAVALFWNDYALPAELQERADAVWRRHAQALFEEEAAGKRSARRGSTGEELQAAGLLDVERREYAGQGALDAEAYLSVTATTSSLLLLADGTRQAVLDGLREVLASAGGQVPFPSSTELWLARAPG